MIVKNEAATIERCLSSVLPAIDTFAILDTGSTDDTVATIDSFFRSAGIEGTIASEPFVDFGTSRNAALDLGRRVSAPSDYILLTDADMELEILDPRFRESLSANAYLVRQTSSITYFNIRLIRAGAGARYVGSTHEYLSVEGPPPDRLDALHFIDHACGSSRAVKFVRDERLLRDELSRDPDNTRALFYLGQTLRDAGRRDEALDFFERRASAAGWEEERWYAQLQSAFLSLEIRGEAAFVDRMIAAWRARPHRAEPIAALASHFRRLGDYERAADFAELLASAEARDDTLFVDEQAHRTAAEREMSISGFYSRRDERRAAGRRACARLAVRRDASSMIRDEARSNFFHYVKPIAELVTGVEYNEISLQPDKGWRPTNPSLVSRRGELHGIVRTVNYTIDSHGRYHGSDGNVIRTRNYRVSISRSGQLLESSELVDLVAGERFATGVEGYEDCRFFEWRGGERALATVRDRSPNARAEIALLRIEDHAVTEAIVLRGYGDALHQKNWLPFVDGDRLFILYLADPTIVLEYSETKSLQQFCVSPAPLDLSHLRGGTPLVRCGDGWIYLAHSVLMRGEARVYLHHFVRLSRELTITALSEPFFFVEGGIEFAAGLTVDESTDDFIVSFGVGDRQAMIASVPREALLGSDRWIS